MVIIPILQGLFNVIVQLVALCSITLAVSYGTVYWRAIRAGGWGSCSQGFTRYARDMFWQSLLLFGIFGTWSARLWVGDNPTPVWDRFLGPVTVAAVSGLLLVQLDVIRDRLVSRTPPHYLFWTASALIIAANLAAGLLVR